MRHPIPKKSSLTTGSQANVILSNKDLLAEY